MDIKPNLTKDKKTWYKTTWGIFLMFGGVFALLLGIIFVVQVNDYSEQIDLDKIETQGITISSNTSFSKPLELIARETIETMDDPSLGNPDAKVVIVEFGDFQCPFCKQVFPTVREMQSEYKDQILYIWRDMPLRELHPQAQKAAEAGECAHEQGKFWAYHDRLFISQARLEIDDLKAYARQTGLDGAKFDQCLDSNKYAFEVNEDLQTGLNLGVEGTPTFFINGQRIAGVIPRDTFRQIITQLLSEN